MKRLPLFAGLAVGLLTGCATTSGADWTRFDDGSLEQWLRGDVVPVLVGTFGEHPRFRDETINVAVLDGTAVAPSSSALAAAVRDTVYAGLSDVAGLKLNRVDGPGGCAAALRDGYYLAVEVTAAGRTRAAVRLRVFDIVEQRWIGGFGGQWRGNLSAAQRDALERQVIADTARGQRVKPFGADESDLLARHLAAELACLLRRNGDDELAIAPAKHPGAALVAGNLAGHGIPVDARGAVELDTRAHQVDDSLYQVWAILTPGETVAGQSAVAVSAYASRPLLRPAAGQITTRRPASTPVVPARVPLLSRLSVASPAPTCRDIAARDLGARPVIAPGECFGVEFRPAPDATLFVLEHAADGALWRRVPSRCESVGEALRGSVRFPNPPDHLVWLGVAGTETYYVLATRGPATARVSKLMARLPDRCDDDTAPTATRRWLDDLDRAVRAHREELAWEAMRIRHAAPGPAEPDGALTGASP